MPRRKLLPDPTDDPLARHAEAGLRRFMTFLLLPARLTREELAVRLGINREVIPLLEQRKLVIPIGHPKPKQMRHYHTATILRQMEDPLWMGKITDAEYAYNEAKNQGASGREEA